MPKCVVVLGAGEGLACIGTLLTAPPVMLRQRFGSSGPAAGGRLRDCFFLQVGDETGVIDVMVLGATDRGTAQNTALADGLTQQCARLRTGQIVVIGGAATGRDGAGRLRLICDSEQGSVIHCASVYGAALHLAVPAIITLHAGVGGGAHRFTAKAVVVEVAGLSRGGRCTWDVSVIFDIIFGRHLASLAVSPVIPASCHPPHFPLSFFSRASPSAPFPSGCFVGAFAT